MRLHRTGTISRDSTFVSGYASTWGNYYKKRSIRPKTVGWCTRSGYSNLVFKSLGNKGLERFFNDGDKRGIRAQQAQRIADVLDRLDASVIEQNMSFAESGLHRLKGTLRNHWSVRVSGNWRIAFRFEDGDGDVVDYQEYH